MAISKDELQTLVNMWNPWWNSTPVLIVPDWRRVAWSKVRRLLVKPRANMALLIHGPLRVGKTSLLMQQISQLLKDGVPPRDILYVNFSKGEASLAGFEEILEVWETGLSPSSTTKYLLFDEMQFVRGWGTKIKNLVDRKKKTRRVVFTCSAKPSRYLNIESGVGRWSELLLGTMSFYEFLCGHGLLGDKPVLPDSLEDLFGWSKRKFEEARQLGHRLQHGFNRYLAVGGYPELLGTESCLEAQERIWEDILDRSLPLNRISPERTRKYLPTAAAFAHLARSGVCPLNKRALEEILDLSPPKVTKLVTTLETYGLIALLPGHSQGKPIPTARSKVYVTDHAIPAALKRLGDKVVDDPAAARTAVGTMVFNHLRQHASASGTDMAYWKDPNGNEVDFLLQYPPARVPIEVDYRSDIDTHRGPKGLRSYHRSSGFERGYLITKSADDLGPMEPIASPGKKKGQVMMVPAPLFCYWMGLMQLHGDAGFRL